MKIPNVPIIDVNTGKLINKWKEEQRETKIKFYKNIYGDDKVYIELHDNRTLYKVVIQSNEDAEWYQHCVLEAARKFKERTGRNIYALGRSARHICVEETDENMKQYRYLKSVALALEKEVIKKYREE